MEDYISMDTKNCPCDKCTEIWETKAMGYKELYYEVEEQNMALVVAIAKEVSAREEIRLRLCLAKEEIGKKDMELAALTASAASRTDAHVRLLEKKLEAALANSNAMMEHVGYVVNFARNIPDPNTQHAPRRYKTLPTFEDAFAKVERGLSSHLGDTAHVHPVYIGAVAQKFKSVEELTKKVVSAD